MTPQSHPPSVTDCTFNTPPQSNNHATLLLHCLHAEHEAKTLMLNVGQQLGEDIGSHILHTNQLQVNGTVTTGSPHSRNGSPTTGLGLSLEAGPSITGV